MARARALRTAGAGCGVCRCYAAAEMKAFITLCAATFLTTIALVRQVQPPRIIVQDKIVAAVLPFRLDEVRLLDGPFKDAMIRDQQYLLSLDVDRLLHNFRVTAGLSSSVAPLGGWEAPDVELRGHSVGHYLSAVSIMYASTGDDRFKARVDTLVTALAAVQTAEAARFHPGYLSAFPEELFDRVDARQRVWAPYYTIHKIMAGLLDAYLLADNQQALQVLTKQANWVKFRVDRLSDEQQQRALDTEFGGMSEVLANLFAVTGESKYLETAKRFEHRRILDPLAKGIDPLDNVHANTQIPKIIGAAREYELTGDPRYRDIAMFFWDRVVHHRSFVMGGNSDGESFFPEQETSHHLGAEGPETCNTYNMLKLTRHLFAWSPTAEAMDFYERALVNQILPSQDPKTGMVSYYCPLKPGAFRTFSTPTDSFWCCVGTGMENHAKYNESIYFHDSTSLYVNLFIPSEVTWSAKNAKIRQATKYPEEDITSLSFSVGLPVRFALKVRHPGWARSGMTVAVNGQQAVSSTSPGSYVTVDREWKSGDTVTVRMPMTLHMEALPDDPHIQALLYGPVVLAGDLGMTGLDGVKRYGPSAPPVGRVASIPVPAFVTTSADQVISHIRPVAGKPLTFQTTNLGQPNDVTLIPFYQTFDPRYTVYWTIYSPAEWEKHKADDAAGLVRRKDIASRTIDLVNVSSDDSERQHKYVGSGTDEGFVEERRWRDAGGTGFLSYDLDIPAGAPVALVCTFRGSEGQRRAFDVLVEGTVIRSDTLEYHPAELLDREYDVPSRLTNGKTKITIRLQPQPGARTGGVVEIRTIQPAR